ncbi:NUDIX domain-containing protein [Primorskyibacter sp. S87]|uniref:NUDIX domain-containing protein n=1 Tax=Primorskyibacter sp. S87 TaxID=3415126 RepID=UPI003C7BCC30
MPDLFFFGTLRHMPLLEVVLGRSADDLAPVAASLPGYSVHTVHDMPFATIHERPGERADGVLLQGLSASDVARLEFYAGGFADGLKPVTLDIAAGGQARAQVCFPERFHRTRGEPWDLGDWARDWGDLSVRTAREVMAGFGSATRQNIAERLPAIRRRAASWVALQQRAGSPDRNVHRDVEILRRDIPHDNFLAMEEMDLRFRRHDGTMSDVVNRSSMMTGRAAVVLPYDPVRDRVVLVEQFRAPVFMAGDPAPWVWEAVAGLVDPGETPEQTAIREAMEEAHVELTRLEPAGEAFSSTGNSNEFCHLFVGLGDLDSTVSGAGVESEHEDIRSEILDYDIFRERLDSMAYKSLHLNALGHWLARHRARLRAEVGIDD